MLTSHRGADCVGGYGGDFPAQGPREVSEYDYSYELYVHSFLPLAYFPALKRLTSHRAL